MFGIDQKFQRELKFELELENLFRKRKGNTLLLHCLISGLLAVSLLAQFPPLAQLPPSAGPLGFPFPSPASSWACPAWPGNRCRRASFALSRCQPGPLVSSSPHLPPARPATGSGGRAATAPAPRASWARRPLLGLNLKEPSPSCASLSRSPLQFRPRSRTGGPSNRRSEIAEFRRPPPREPPSPSRLRSDFSLW